MSIKIPSINYGAKNANESWLIEWIHEYGLYVNSVKLITSIRLTIKISDHNWLILGDSLAKIYEVGHCRGIV